MCALARNDNEICGISYLNGILENDSELAVNAFLICCTEIYNVSLNNVVGTDAYILSKIRENYHKRG